MRASAECHTRLDGDHLPAVQRWRSRPRRRHPEGFADLLRPEKPVPGAVPVSVLENPPLDTRCLRFRVDFADPAEETSNILFDGAVLAGAGEVGLDLTFPDDDARRSSLHKEVGQRVEGRWIGAHRKL